MELEANIQNFFSSDAETFKNRVFPPNFESRYPTHFIPEGNMMDFLKSVYKADRRIVDPVTYPMFKTNLCNKQI